MGQDGRSMQNEGMGDAYKSSARDLGEGKSTVGVLYFYFYHFDVSLLFFFFFLPNSGDIFCSPTNQIRYYWMRKIRPVIVIVIIIVGPFSFSLNFSLDDDGFLIYACKPSFFFFLPLR